MLVEHLPRDSAFSRGLHGEEAQWGVTEHLLAAVVDQLAVANWMFATVNVGEDAEPPPYPDPVPRPGDQPTAEPSEPQPASASQTEIVAFLRTPA